MAPSATSLFLATKLSPYIFTYEPSETQSTSSSASDPKLIILAAWMDAQDVHIAKYSAHYQSVYPNATHLVIKFVMKEAMLAPVANSIVQPAVWYLRSLIAAGNLSAAPSRPEILVHLFSNGGATSMQNMYASYTRVFGQTFPLHCAVFDSCPGQHAFSTSYNALIAGFPRGLLRFIVSPFIILMILTSWLWHIPFGFLAGEDFLSKNARVLNDRNLVKQTNRTYIYGKADAMVDWSHIENHAKKAASRGFDVRKEVFEKSPHVAHMRTDSQRYWRIVEETWRKSTTIEQ
ncbi:putative indole-diterpene biosynthesis protein [Rosellinia necatrix]|uniref:Putative indole-diterpene biosynthesis protein n=1 Tax=Rosellinia necatrix TaxID=77044 RepID=A0A1W2TP22_ROSNE|nr:putative indole-diterpene biosynthesis protein [Rosellinia necatrix]